LFFSCDKRQKYFQIGDAYACPDSDTMPSYFNGSALKEQQINKISFYGYINVTEDIPGPWEVILLVLFYFLISTNNSTDVLYII